MIFSQLYGEELSLQLSSVQTSGLFTTVRRKAQINNGQREFVRLTECIKKNGSLPLVDATATYDLEATFTDPVYWWLSSLEGISVAIVNGSTTRYLVEGKKANNLRRVDKRRLDDEHPGWRGASAGTPRYLYLDVDGGATNLGFYPAPAFASGDAWTATVPYVGKVPDMVADADEPFTFSTNVVKRLEPWHMACVHYAAYKLEWSRPDKAAAQTQLQLFAALVKDFLDKQTVPGGDVVAYAHDYLAAVQSRGVFAGDPLVDW